jgi:hypothetical protein
LADSPFIRAHIVTLIIDAAVTALLLPGLLSIREFYFLQIRMICELIALGCLVAHGDIKATQTRAFRAAWSPAEIIPRLEKLHPEFFPKPVSPTLIGTRIGHLADASAGALTKDELLVLYGRCGNVLHRGSTHKLLSGNIPVQTHFPAIVRWADKIRKLLEHHVVLMHGGQTVFVCALVGPGGRAVTDIGLAEGPSKYVPPSVR